MPAPLNPSPEPNAAPAQNFEGALDRLENIVKRMEADRLPLEELLTCYEEGTRLVKTCGEFLAAAEQRIELIARDAQGQPQAVPFTADNVAKTGAMTAPPANPTPPNGGNARRSPGVAKTAPAAASVPAPSPPSTASHHPHEVSLF